MSKNILAISICIGIAATMILSAFPCLIAETNISFDEEKVYTGPKVVFNVKGKPGGNPGGGHGGGGQGGGKLPKVDKWAVVIGIADYQGIGNDLLYPDDDALDMYNYLISKGYPSKNIKLLTNRKATANNIIRAIDWMDKQEKKNTSECVFFYSGHGSWYDGYDDGDSEYRDEGIVSSDLYLILDGQLKNRFSTFTSEKIAFTFDSCFSGGMDDLAGSGRIVVAACGETEYSYDGTSDQQNGVFTYYYMDGLNTYNTVEGAFTYAAPLAHNFVENYGAEMNPQIYDQYAGNWEF